MSEVSEQQVLGNWCKKATKANLIKKINELNQTIYNQSLAIEVHQSVIDILLNKQSEYED